MMNKIKASVAVIGFQKEDHRMYPHLHDFLQNLRNVYDEVIYIEDDDRGEGLYLIDTSLRNISNIFNFKSFKNMILGFYSFFYLFKYIFLYLSRRRKLIERIKNVNLNHDKSFVVAIDHTAAYFAGKYFPGNIIFWNLDILAKDAPWRLENGFLEKLITSENALKAKVLMIQDEDRKKLLEESFGINFPQTVYLPISLNDSEFCRKASENRQKKNTFSTVNIIQNGWIAENRWSDQLIDAYRNWPACYKLHLHGFMGDRMESRIKNAQRKPDVSTLIYGSDSLVRVLNNYDIGFVGYNEPDSNFNHIKNASSQMVMFLRLGIPVIGCGSPLFNDFVTKQNIGIGISSPEGAEDAIKQIIDNYSFFSYKARNLYELRLNLNNIFNNYLIKAFEKYVC